MLHNKRGLLFLVIGLFFSVCLSAQTLSSVFEKYAENKAFRYVSISKGMINLSTLFGKADAGNVEMTSKVEGMKILTLKSPRKSAVSNAFFVDVEKTLSSDIPFESLMEARENGVYTRVYNRENKKNKTDIVIISKSDTVQHFIWLNGNISTLELQKMIKK